MEKFQTPVVAGVGGAAILAALLSFGGGDSKKAAAPQSAPSTKQLNGTEPEAAGAPPNQEGPWRAVCEEYAPNGVYSEDPTQILRGYRVGKRPTDAMDDALEIATPDKLKRMQKVAVHRQLVGDLVSCIPKPQLSGIHLIIATLPDPDKTEMRLEFDRYVEALERAAAIRGFHYTGYWFPWSPRQTGPPPHKQDEVEAALLRAEQPGILLFRNDGGERLFIFVVGETPTSGINRTQMTHALRYRQALIGALRRPEQYPNHDVPLPAFATDAARLDGPLMISGPHFSGALASLAEVLQESPLPLTANPTNSVRIISPDVSSDTLIKKFNEPCTPALGCSFRSLSITGVEKDIVGRHYLNKLGYENKQIALLVEDESAVGDSQIPGDSQILKDVGNSPDPKDDGQFGLILRFPRELSAARSLSDQQSEQLAESGARLLSLSRNPGNIKLAGQEPTERDRPSTYASDVEATEISNGLENDIRLMKERGIQCIVVTATNPLDRIFLLEYFHDRLPNIRAVVEDADELIISRPHFVDLTGTIVISSLPTVPQFAAVKGNKPVFMSFASVAAEEQFLSAAILLDPVVMSRDIRKAVQNGADAPENADIRPDDWSISIAGEEGFELIPFGVNRSSPGTLTGTTPVFGQDWKNAGKTMEEASQKSEDGVALEVSAPEKTPRLFISFSIAIFVLTLCHLVMLLNAESVPFRKAYFWLVGGKPKDGHSFQSDTHELLPRFSYLERRKDKQSKEYPDGKVDTEAEEDRAASEDLAVEGGRIFNMLALNSQIFLLDLLVLMDNPVLWPVNPALWPVPPALWPVNPALWPWVEGPLGLRWIAFGAWLMIASMSIPLSVSISRYLGLFVKTLFSDGKGLRIRTLFCGGKFLEKLAASFFFFLMLCYLLSSVAFLILWRSGAIAEWQRVLNLDDGLSPVVPIAAILLAWALWAALQLRRVKWIAHRKIDLSTFEGSLPAKSLGASLSQDIQAIHTEIDPPTIGLARVIVVLLSAFVIAWWQWHSLRGIEPYRRWAGDSNGNWLERLAQPILSIPFFSIPLNVLIPRSFQWWFGFWGFVMLLITVILVAYQLYQIWDDLVRLLQRLESTRMKRAFESIGEDDCIHIKLWDFGKTQLRFDEMELIIESLRKMFRFAEANEAKKALDAYRNADLDKRQPTHAEMYDLNKALNVRMKDALEQLEEDKVARVQGIGGPLNSNLWRYAKPVGRYSEELDRYLALRLSTLIRYVLLQMRNLMWFVIYGYFLAVVSVTFYPFQGGKNLSDMLAVTFVIVLLIMGRLVTQILRNPTLKRLEDKGSDPGSIFQAALHLLSVGGLPILALLAWQFPWIGRIAFSWLRPLLSAFR